MHRTILLLALVVLITAAIYIIKDIYTAEPVAVAEAEPSLWLSPSEWHWPGEVVECVSYTVGVGDTLWGIARRYYPDRDPREVVWAIRRVSELQHAEGPILQPGQVIIIPDPSVYGVGKR